MLTYQRVQFQSFTTFSQWMMANFPCWLKLCLIRKLSPFFADENCICVGSLGNFVRRKAQQSWQVTFFSPHILKIVLCSLNMFLHFKSTSRESMKIHENPAFLVKNPPFLLQNPAFLVKFHWKNLFLVNSPPRPQDFSHDKRVDLLGRSGRSPGRKVILWPRWEDRPYQVTIVISCLDHKKS